MFLHSSLPCNFGLSDACFVVVVVLNYIAIAVLGECSYNGEKWETLFGTTLIHFLPVLFIFQLFRLSPVETICICGTSETNTEVWI